MVDRRIQFERRVNRIGFMGKGARMPGRRPDYDAPHSISLRIGDDRVATSAEETAAARFDLLPMPRLLGGLFSRVPDAVVRPGSAEETAEALSICFEERARVVPRGGATFGLGGVVPVRGGVVLDSVRLNRVLDVDREKHLVSAEAGARWKQVIQALSGEGMAPLAFPSSSARATVGGWVSAGGLGVGALRHGNFHESITSLEAVLPAGFLVEAAGREGRYSVPSFAGTEGQMGVVTRATFRIRPAPERSRCWLIRLQGPDRALSVFRDLLSLERVPYSVELVVGAPAGLYGSGLAGGFLLVTDEGDSVEVERAGRSIGQVLAGSGLEADESVDAPELRDARLQAQAGGGDRLFYTCGVVLGVDNLAGFVPQVLASGPGGVNTGVECRAVERGKALVTLGVEAGPGGPGPFKAFLRLRNLVALGVRLGGVPYGAGLWNSPYINVIVGDRKKGLRRVKSEVDRLSMMNPGKFFSVTTKHGLPVPGWAQRALFLAVGRG